MERADGATRHRRDTPMKPQVVAYELNKLLADDAIVATDSGTITTWIARQIQIRGGMMFSCSGNLATMACGLPYAIAAAVAYPGRQVVAFVGDGGLTMLMGELATCMKYDLDVKIVVIKNNVLGQIKWEQMVFLGNPEYVCELQPIDFAAVARGFGMAAYTIDDPAACGDTLRAGAEHQGPGADRGGGRSQRAADAADDLLRRRQELRRGARPGHPRRRQDRPHRRRRQGARADLRATTER